jgi:hypothetical protein
VSTGWVANNTAAYINRLVRKELLSKQVQARPLFYFISGNSQPGLQALLTAQKNPDESFKRGLSLGGADLGLAQRVTMRGSEKAQFRYQKDEPDNGQGVAPGGATAVATKFSEDLVGTMQMAWTMWNWALKVRQSTLDNLGGMSEQSAKWYIANVAEEAVAMSFNRAYQNKQTQFWNGTLTESQQGQIEWYQNNLGVTHWVSDGTTAGEEAYKFVGQVNRTTATQLKSTVLTAAALVSGGYIPTQAPTLDLIRKIRTINALGGIANRDPDAGDLVITTPELFNTLASEAEGQAQIWRDPTKPVPGTGMALGFKYPVIVKDGAFITYDPDCPSGELYVLTTKTWMYEIRDGYNFMQTPWVEKNKVEEGGEMYSWKSIYLKDRLTCLKPWLQVKVKGLVAA